MKYQYKKIINGKQIDIISEEMAQLEMRGAIKDKLELLCFISGGMGYISAQGNEVRFVDEVTDRA